MDEQANRAEEPVKPGIPMLLHTVWYHRCLITWIIVVDAADNDVDIEKVPATSQVEQPVTIAGTFFTVNMFLL